MTTTHVPCGSAIAFRLVLDDAGEPVIVYWCERCDRAAQAADCDPPVTLASVPPEQLARLLAVARDELAARERNAQKPQ